MSLREILAGPGLAGTTWSVSVRGPGGGTEAVDEDVLLPTASVAKLFLLVELAARVERGRVSLADLVDRRRTTPVHDSGTWQHLAVDRLTVGDAARLVGLVSDNWATNCLLDLVTLEAVTARAETLAPGGSRLLDRVRDRRTPADPPVLSVGCAADYVRLLADLHAGLVVSPGVSRRVLDWLAPSVDLSMVAAALGLDPLAHVGPDRGLAVWSKTGTDTGVRADVGLVTGPRGTVAYAAICTWDEAEGDRRDAVLAAMRAIGEVVRSRCS